MPTALEFKGEGVKHPTPNGGYVQVALGHIVEDESGKTAQAIAFRIVDGEQNKVAEFALLADTFGVLMEAMLETFQRAFGDDDREDNIQQPDKQ